jgi:hypothetical protein
MTNAAMEGIYRTAGNNNNNTKKKKKRRRGKNIPQAL